MGLGAPVVADEQQRVTSEEGRQNEVFVRFLPAKDTEFRQNHDAGLLSWFEGFDSKKQRHPLMDTTPRERSKITARVTAAVAPAHSSGIL